MLIDLKSIRLKQNLTQRELAQKIGITQQYYNYIEHHKRRPSPELAKRLSTLLQIDPLYFYPELKVNIN